MSRNGRRVSNLGCLMLAGGLLLGGASLYFFLTGERLLSLVFVLAAPIFAVWMNRKI